MNQKTIIAIIVIFTLLIAGMFVFAYLKKTEITQEDGSMQDQAQEDVKYASITRIEAKHFYIDGVHTVAGEIPMPTPCDLLDAQTVVAESYPEQITLDFSVINNAEFCAQQITPQRFKVSVEASEEASFNARFMGRDVELNLIPALDGETPDTFELFIKG